MTYANFAQGPVRSQLGDIAVTDQQVLTPRGPIGRAEAQWYVQDFWGVRREIPQWAMICAIIGIFIVGPLSLLLLIVQEDVVKGFIQVTVSGDGIQHTTRLPVNSVPQAHAIRNQLGWMQSQPVYA